MERKERKRKGRTCHFKQKKRKGKVSIVCLKVFVFTYRSAIEHEKKGYAENFEQGHVMEKNLIAMAREVEKLRAEVANVEKRAQPTGTINAGPWHLNILLIFVALCYPLMPHFDSTFLNNAIRLPKSIFAVTVMYYFVLYAFCILHCSSFCYITKF